jgi:peptidoglycan/xylan/chitin deacetylase (PgdA/CDA1 family)
LFLIHQKVIIQNNRRINQKMEEVRPNGEDQSAKNAAGKNGPAAGVAAPLRGAPPPGRLKAAPSLALAAGSAAFAAALVLLFVRPSLAAIPPAIFVLMCLVTPFWPGSGFFLPVVHRRKTDRRAVCLTFDDGPDPDVTPRLLELLSRHGAPATFFVTGVSAERCPGLIRELLLGGHSLGNHSYHHDVLLMLRSRARLREEIARMQELLAAFAVRPLTFRPPVGITNPRLGGVLDELGLTCVLFSCRAGDMGNRRIAGLADAILKKVRPGDIILLHDVKPRGACTVGTWLAEMERILCGLKERGYEVLPLAELIGRPVMETLAGGGRARCQLRPGEGRASGEMDRDDRGFGPGRAKGVASGPEEKTCRGGF